MQGGWAAKNASTFARTRRLRNTTRPDASAPCAWKTRFAISNPIVLACPTDASSSGRSTPPPWHADAVRGRPSHHSPREASEVRGGAPFYPNPALSTNRPADPCNTASSAGARAPARDAGRRRAEALDELRANGALGHLRAQRRWIARTGRTRQLPDGW